MAQAIGAPRQRDPIGIIITVMWFWIILIPIVLIIVIPRIVGQSKARSQGHDRCAYCRTKLKYNADRTGFATTCRKCGRTQTWA